MIPDEWVWIVVVGFIVSFFLAFGLGANDVASSFGTSVGSKVLTLRQACFLATIFETLGSVLVGQKVTNTIRTSIIDPASFNNSAELRMLTDVASLSGGCIWMILATLLKLPVSSSHSIIGAVIGAYLVAKNGHVMLSTWTLVKIGLSWITSPILSGLTSCGLFFLIRITILNKAEQLLHGLRFLPIFYGVTLVINIFSVLYDGSSLLKFDTLPWYFCLLVSLNIGVLVAIMVTALLVPYQRRKIIEQLGRAELAAIASVEAVPQSRADSVETETILDTLAELTEESSVADDTLSRLRAADAAEAAEQQRGIELKGATVTWRDWPAERHVSTDEPSERTNRGRRHSRDRTQSNPDAIAHRAPEPLLPEPLLRRSRHTQRPYLRAISFFHIPVPTAAHRFHPTQLDRAFTEAPLQRSRLSTTGSILIVPECLRHPNVIGSGQDGAEENGPKGADLVVPAQPAAGHYVVGSQDVDSPEISLLFRYLQILTATFASFAHGGNDVANAIGPLVSLYLIATDPVDNVFTKGESPLWLLAFGGIGICVGLWVLGRRVIETLGEGLTKITPSSGFCIELGTSLTVLIASNLAIPVSSTHCKVGSVVSVGCFRSGRPRDHVNWKLFLNIVISWIVTVPVSGALSALVMLILMAATGLYAS